MYRLFVHVQCTNSLQVVIYACICNGLKTIMRYLFSYYFLLNMNESTLIPLAIYRIYLSTFLHCITITNAYFLLSKFLYFFQFLCVLKSGNGTHLFSPPISFLPENRIAEQTLPDFFCYQQITSVVYVR